MRPRQPVVRHNDYRSLEVPALGGWTPRLSVSVVVPAYNYQRTLPYVLAGLAAQSYPEHLLEVVVVDDGSDPVQQLPEVRPGSTRLVRVTDGWGRANACRLGAEVADGDVLHWYDADMLPFREQVEAHMRWHHLIDYAVPGGDKRFVDPAWVLDQDPAQVRDRVAAGEADRFFPGTPHEEHSWVERYWHRTGDLTTAGPRAQRVHIGMTGSVSRALYAESRGFDPELRLGEDMALGHELAQVGGVFVVDREALSWHLGRSQVLRRAEQVNRYNQPFLAHLVPAMRPKRRRQGRIYEVPYLEVVLDVTDLLTGKLPEEGVEQPADRTVACVDALLDCDFDDLRVVLVGPWDRLHADRVSPVEDPLRELRIVHRWYVADPRVVLAAEVPPVLATDAGPGTDAEFRLTLPDASHAPLRPTLQLLLEDLERTHHGLRVVRYPGGGAARLERVAALARAARVCPVGSQDLDPWVEQVAGAGEYDAAEVGFVPTRRRPLPRFELGPAPATAPDESRAKLLEALREAAQHEPGRPKLVRRGRRTQE